jgi:hypothetical protein
MQLQRPAQNQDPIQSFPIGGVDDPHRAIRGRDGVRASDLPDPRDNRTRPSKYAPERLDVAAFELRRVAKTIRVPSLRAPDGHGMPALLRAGKVVSSQHYDFDELRGHGVELVSVDAEIAPMQPVAHGSAGPTIGELVDSLAKAGLRVVPADAPAQAAPPSDPSEVEQLKAQNAAMQAQLAEMQRAITELTSAKKK